jgi:glycosyltransferase involved in cell wall biosynthesis
MGDHDWGETMLPECWMDFARNEKGILFTIYDPSRIRYLIDYRGQSEPLVRFLSELRFEKWAYIPVDSTGPRGILTGILGDTIARLDRIVTYTLWGQDIIRKSTWKEVDYIPHGVNFNAFQIREKAGARLAMGLGEDAEIIGMVATNQTRKDWGLVCCIADQLRKLRPGLRFWFHIDEMIRHWNLYALIQDYGLADVVKVTLSGSMNDKELSWHYSACDLTLLLSSEGFGYPIVESLACGVPCIHSNYAGGAELIPNPDWLVEPITYRLEGIYNCLKPVWEPQSWINAVMEFFKRGRWTPEECRKSIEHLDWNNLGIVWRKWFLSGIGLGGT